MVALFFHFSKRQNSTKRPNDSDGTELSISIRGNVPSGQLSSQSGTEYYDTHPTIWVSGNSNYNYVKMPGSNRYYFVRDRQREINNATVYYLEEDYLATWADEIKGSTQKVLLSSSKYDLNIDDLRNVETESTSWSYSTSAFPWTGSESNPTYLVTVSGGKSLATTYVFTANELESTVLQTIYGSLIDAQNDDIISQSINRRNVSIEAEQQAYAADAIDAIKQLVNVFSAWAKDTSNGIINQLGGVFDSIKDVRMTALDADTHRSGRAHFWLGTIDGGKDADIAFGTLTSDVTIAIPHQGSNYRKGPRFSSYGIYIPYCGQYQLNADSLYNLESVTVKLGIDRKTGDITGYVYGTDVEDRLITFSGSAASSQIIALHDNSLMTSVAKAVANGVLDTASGIVFGGGAAAAKGAFGTVSRLLNGIEQTKICSGGSMSSFAGGCAGNRIAMFSVMKGAADSLTAIKDVAGLQCHQTLALSGISGYCRCADASLDMQGMLNEKEEVINHMNSGFFLE